MRQEVKHLLSHIADQNSLTQPNPLRAAGNRMFNFTLDTMGYTVNKLGDWTGWTTRKAEGVTQFGLRNVSRIGYTQPYIAYCLGWYAFNYQNAISQRLIDSVQSNINTRDMQVMSEAEERKYLFQHTKLSLARILNGTHYVDDLSVLVNYLTWIRKNTEQRSSEEDDLVRAIERMILPKMSSLHQTAR